MLKMQVIGYLGRDAEVIEINPENMAIKFSVAHTYKDKTVWVECTIFRKPNNLGIAQYLKKGTQVHVDGLPSVHAYTTSTGEVAGKMQLIVNDVQLLGSKAADQSQPQATPQPQAQTELPKDDLPF